MSRIGKKPVAILDGVKVAVSQREITVEGKLGKLVWTHRPEIDVKVEGKEVVVTRSSDDRLPRALHGLTRAIIRNMVEGVATASLRRRAFGSPPPQTPGRMGPGAKGGLPADGESTSCPPSVSSVVCRTRRNLALLGSGRRQRRSHVGTSDASADLSTPQHTSALLSTPA